MTWLFGMQGEDGKRLSRPLLRRAAALAWGWRALPELARSGRGKPYFRHWPERWFSLSHSGGLTLCALSDDGPVGLCPVSGGAGGMPGGLGGVLPPVDAEGELVQAGGFPPLPAQGGGDASPLSPPQLYRTGLAGGGVLLWNTAGGCPLDGAGGDALKVS